MPERYLAWLRSARGHAVAQLQRVPIVVWTFAGCVLWLSACITPSGSGAASFFEFVAAQWPGILTAVGVAVRAQSLLRKSQARVAISDEERAQIADSAAERAVHSMAATIDAQRRDLETAQRVVHDVTRLREDAEHRADIDVAAALKRVAEAEKALRDALEREAESGRMIARLSTRTEALNAELHELRRAIRTAGIHVAEPAPT